MLDGRIRRILFVQQPGVLPQQRGHVTQTLANALPGCCVDFVSRPEDLVETTGYDAVITPTLPWLPELLQRVEDTPWIHFLSSGVDRIWAMPVDWSRYQLTSSKGVHAVPISEYVLGAMLHFAKRLDQFTAQARDGVWERAWLSELTDAQVVIVGAGSIGREVARRCRFLGMRVTVVARSARADTDLGDVLGLGQLPWAVATADYLVVAVPLTAETVGLVGENVLGNAKPGVVLIDVSRGGVVPEAAVVGALDAGALRGAALDVFEDEPLASESSLWGRSNVLVTPHVAGTTSHYLERALELFVDNASRVMTGSEPLTGVDSGRGY